MEFRQRNSWGNLRSVNTEFRALGEVADDDKPARLEESLSLLLGQIVD